MDTRSQRNNRSKVDVGPRYTPGTKVISSKKVDNPHPRQKPGPYRTLRLRKIPRNPVDIRTQLDTKTQVDVRPQVITETPGKCPGPRSKPGH